MKLTPAQIVAIAAGAHEINRAYCVALGDMSQPEWNEAPPWQQDSTIKGVEFHLAHPEATASGSHNEWLKVKLADGWVYGEVKDPEAKTHPCIVPFEKLPREQQAKDHLFRATVHMLAAQQHRKITGYRELSGYEIALMNRIKAHGTETDALLEEVNRHLQTQHDATMPKYAEPSAEPEAQSWRWLGIARTHLQQGLMAVTRAVAQPTSF